MKRNSDDQKLDTIDVPDDFWLPEEDLLMLHGACTKKQKRLPTPEQRSAEWKELTPEMPSEIRPCYIQGIVLQLFKAKKDRWTKIYLKRDQDIGVCLADKTSCLDNIKIGSNVLVWIRGIIDINEHSDVSKVICTSKFGIMADPEIVLEAATEIDAPPAKFDWDSHGYNLSLAECYDLVQLAMPTRFQAKVSVVWAREPNEGRKKKSGQRPITIRDRRGITGTLMLSLDVEGLEAGREIVLSGFNIELERGSFKISLGPDSALQVCGISHDAIVPIINTTRSIGGIRTILESKTGPFEDVYEIEGLITQFALKRSVYGICAACGTWQLVLSRKSCKKCGPAEFVKLKFDISISIADGSGEWSGLHLKDPIASKFLRNTPYECKLAEAEQEFQLSWVRALVKVSLSQDNLKSIILEIRETNPNVRA